MPSSHHCTWCRLWQVEWTPCCSCHWWLRWSVTRLQCSTFSVHLPYYLWPQVLGQSRAKDEIGDASVGLLILYRMVSRFGFILIPGAAKQRLGNQSLGQADLSITIFLRDKKQKCILDWNFMCNVAGCKRSISTRGSRRMARMSTLALGNPNELIHQLSQHQSLLQRQLVSRRPRSVRQSLPSEPVNVYVNVAFEFQCRAVSCGKPCNKQCTIYMGLKPLTHFVFPKQLFIVNSRAEWFSVGFASLLQGMACDFTCSNARWCWKICAKETSRAVQHGSFKLNIFHAVGPDHFSYDRSACWKSSPWIRCRHWSGCSNLSSCNDFKQISGNVGNGSKCVSLLRVFFYNLAFDANKCIKIMPSVCFNAHILLRLRVRLLCARRKTWWVMWGCQLPLLPVDWSGLLLLQKGMKREVHMRNSRSTSWESLFLFLWFQIQKTREGNHCKVYDLEIGPSSWHKEIAFIFFQASWVPMLNEKNQYGNPFGKNFASQMVNMKFLTWKGRVLSSWRTPMLWHFMGTKAVAAESRLFLFANFGQCLGEDCGQPKKNRGKFQLHDGMSNKSSTT